jgi:hypothetical protein
MPAYTGQLTAGPSDLQKQAWKGISTLTVPTNITAAGNEAGSIGDQLRGTTYKPGTITGSDFDTAAAQKYMNPYIEAALNPQLEALRKAAKIAENDQLGKLAVAGALGGTKEAQLQALNRENLFKQQQGILGTGYASAYDKAASQFNTDQTRNIDVQKANEANAQFAAKFGVDALNDALKAQESRARIGADEAKYGLANLEALSKAGATKQELEQAAVNADYNEYLRQLKYPQEMLKLQKDLIQGTDLGKTTEEYGTKPSTMDQIKGGFKSAAGIIDALGGSENIMGSLKKLGVPVDDAVRYLKNLMPNTNQIGDSQIKDYYEKWGTPESTEDYLSKFTDTNVEIDPYLKGVFDSGYGEDFSLA